jgi:hypothetical protein
VKDALDAARYRWLNKASLEQLIFLVADTPRGHWDEQVDEWMEEVSGHSPEPASCLKQEK